MNRASPSPLAPPCGCCCYWLYSTSWLVRLVHIIWLVWPFSLRRRSYTPLSLSLAPSDSSALGPPFCTLNTTTKLPRLQSLQKRPSFTYFWLPATSFWSLCFWTTISKRSYTFCVTQKESDWKKGEKWGREYTFFDRAFSTEQHFGDILVVGCCFNKETFEL